MSGGGVASTVSASPPVVSSNNTNNNTNNTNNTNNNKGQGESHLTQKQHKLDSDEVAMSTANSAHGEKDARAQRRADALEQSKGKGYDEVEREGGHADVEELHGAVDKTTSSNKNGTNTTSSNPSNLSDKIQEKAAETFGVDLDKVESTASAAGDGAVVGGTAGTAVGAVAGIPGGPVGSAIGAAAGAATGAAVGAVTGAVADAHANDKGGKRQGGKSHDGVESANGSNGSNGAGAKKEQYKESGADGKILDQVKAAKGFGTDSNGKSEAGKDSQKADGKANGEQTDATKKMNTNANGADAQNGQAKGTKHDEGKAHGSADNKGTDPVTNNHGNLGDMIQRQNAQKFGVNLEGDE